MNNAFVSRLTMSSILSLIFVNEESVTLTFTVDLTIICSFSATKSVFIIILLYVSSSFSKVCFKVRHGVNDVWQLLLPSVPSFPVDAIYNSPSILNKNQKILFSRK